MFHSGLILFVNYPQALNILMVINSCESVNIITEWCFEYSLPNIQISEKRRSGGAAVNCSNLSLSCIPTDTIGCRQPIVNRPIRILLIGCGACVKDLQG